MSNIDPASKGAMGPSYTQAESAQTVTSDAGTTQFLVNLVQAAAGAAGMASPLGIGGGGGAGQYQALIAKQIQAQNEGLVFQSQSNTLKSQHDTNMNTVRNIRS
jgi:hypothetical protein